MGVRTKRPRTRAFGANDCSPTSYSLIDFAAIADPKNKDKVLESVGVPNGAILLVENGATIHEKQPLCKWDPHITPIITDVPGKVRFDEIEEDHTLRKERDKETGA